MRPCYNLGFSLSSHFAAEAQKPDLLQFKSPLPSDSVQQNGFTPSGLQDVLLLKIRLRRLLHMQIYADCIFLAESSELRTRTASWERAEASLTTNYPTRAVRRTQVTDFRQAKSHSNAFYAESLQVLVFPLHKPSILL